MVKKAIIITALLVVGIPLVLYLLNPYGIYKLTDKTARFIEMQTVPSGLESLKAADCGACHVEIYQEWKTSLHAKAFEDPFFKAYHRKDKGDPTCLICHTPLQNQSPVILSSESGLYDDMKVTGNPDFDAELQQEGVTCSACHVRDGVVYTPDLTSALDGITRKTVIALAQEEGLNVVEKRITRDEVYIADEAFFTGSAAEVTPIREVDNRAIGSGTRGPITERLQTKYFDAVHGRGGEHPEWLTLV